jgi:threonine/homoserine/homoserine lactone efflux protein
VIGIHDLALFVGAGLLLNVTPGPDMAYIAARGASGGFRAGVAAALGITAGCVVHTIAAAAGLSVVLATSAAAFGVVKWCGAAYLLYAGVRLLAASLHAPRAAPAAALLPPAAPRRIFREAFVINVFNPKVALFFLAFLPQFVVPQAAGNVWAFLFLGLVFNVNGTLWNLLVAWVTATLGQRLQIRGRWATWLRRLAGGTFVALGIELALAERR